MPRKRSVFDEEIDLINKFEGNKTLSKVYSEFRTEWRNRGPVEFALHVLRIDPNTGKALYISDDQKEFLEDLWMERVRLAIICAGRGAGKTFILAVYVAWRIFCFEKWHVAAMGGSAEQSDKIRAYLVGWIRSNNDLKKFKMKMTEDEIKTFSDGSVTFHACAGTSVRGPHTHDVIIDEQAEGEKSGGEKTIKAAIWDASTSPDIHIIKSSTAHWIFGDFLHTWNNFDKLGYKRYQWSIVKHTNGIKDPNKIYMDMNPRNWQSNVPWIPDRNVPIMRNNASNEEWLVEALGGISIMSGLVFHPADIESCVCSRCLDEGKECHPYEEGYCPIVQYYLTLEGMNPKEISPSVKEALQNVKERVEGIDWGKNSPCAYSVVGRYRGTAFVLFSTEKIGQSDNEKVGLGASLGKKWFVDILRPDPREWAYNNVLSGLGFAVHQLFSEGGQEKSEYLYVLKRFVERHKLIIPVAFDDLIRSMKQLSYDDKGNVRKQDDHSFDSLLYAISYYGEMANQGAFWKAMTKATNSPFNIDAQDEEDLNNSVKKEEPVKKDKPHASKEESESKPEDDPWKRTWGGFDLWI